MSETEGRITAAELQKLLNAPEGPQEDRWPVAAVKRWGREVRRLQGLVVAGVLGSEDNFCHGCGGYGGAHVAGCLVGLAEDEAAKIEEERA